MQMNCPYDADSIAARYAVQDLLTIAARERALHDVGGITTRRVPIAEIGHLLVRFGRWLQTLTRQPAYQEETI